MTEQRLKLSPSMRSKLTVVFGFTLIIIALVSTTVHFHKMSGEDSEVLIADTRNLQTDSEFPDQTKNKSQSRPASDVSDLSAEQVGDPEQPEMLSAFNLEFHSALDSGNSQTIRALLQNYYSLLRQVKDNPSALQYNAACYYGELIGRLNREGILTEEEETQWIEFLEYSIREKNLDEEYRSALLFSAISSGLDRTVCNLSKEALTSSETKLDSHMARRAAGALMRVGQAQDRDFALDYAKKHSEGGAVDTIVAYTAENQYEGAIADLVELKGAGVRSPLFANLQADEMKAIAVIIEAEEGPQSDAAMSLAVGALDDHEAREALVDRMRGTILDTNQSDGSRLQAYAHLLKMTEHMPIRQGKAVLAGIRPTVESDPLFQHARAYVISVCESEITD